jgi:3-oxoacid CoA-transferase subunit A
VTLAEVEHLVEIGELGPDEIVTPGIFVDRVLLAAPRDKPIEQRTVRAR